MAQDLVGLYSFDGPYVAFVHNYLKKHFWRVERYMAYEDVIQEAAWQFILLLRRMEKNRAKFEIQLKEQKQEVLDAPEDKYLIKNPKHLMSLWVTNWTRHFHTLSIKDSKKLEEPIGGFITDEDSDMTSLLESKWFHENAGYVECLVRDAPRESLFLYNLLFSLSTEVFNLAYTAFEHSRASGRGDKYFNSFICKMGGFKANVDIVSQFRQHFRPD